jgi:hypothetical protein
MQVTDTPGGPDAPPSVPPLWPFLLSCAAAALWADLGTIHRDQHSDSILNVLISLQRWTPFYWEQDRFGTAIPLLAVPFRHPLANLLVQGFLSIFGGLSAFFLLARQAIRDASYPAVATLGAATFLTLTPAPYRFEYLIDQPYGVGLSLALGGLILLEGGRGGPGWARWVGALVLVALAHWVNCGTAVFLCPLVLLEGVLGRERGRRREAVRALLVLAVGFGIGRLLMSLSPDHMPVFGTRPPARWPSGWWHLARRSWIALRPPLWPAALALEAAVGVAVMLRPGRGRSPVAAAKVPAALLGAALVLAMLAGTSLWVERNAYEPRYLFPSAILSQVAVAAMAIPRREATVSRARAVPALGAGLVLLAASGVSYGLPSIAGIRRDLDRRCGALTADLLDARCTHLAGDYWTVWVAVFHANLVLHDRGEARMLWGVSYRAGPTVPLWDRVAMNERRVAIPVGDAMGEHWLKSYDFPPLRLEEVRPTIRVLRPWPSPESGRPLAGPHVLSPR